MLSQHIQEIDNAIRECTLVVKYTMYKEQLSPNTGYIEGEIFFINNSRLAYFEFYNLAESSIECEKYRYQFMDSNNQLIFRYDNAPHHSEISSFPHHKHVPSGVVESVPLHFSKVLKEVESNILLSI